MYIFLFDAPEHERARMCSNSEGPPLDDLAHQKSQCSEPFNLLSAFQLVVAVFKMAATGAATGGGGAPAPAAAVERVDDGTTVTLQCKDSKPIECPTVLAQQMMYIEALPKPSTGDDDDDDDDEEEGASGENGPQIRTILHCSLPTVSFSPALKVSHDVYSSTDVLNELISKK